MVIISMHKPQRKMGKWNGKSILFEENIIWIFRMLYLNTSVSIVMLMIALLFFLMLFTRILLCTSWLKFRRIIHVLSRKFQRCEVSPTIIPGLCWYVYYVIRPISSLHAQLYIYYAEFVLLKLWQIRKVLKVQKMFTYNKYGEI